MSAEDQWHVDAEGRRRHRASDLLDGPSPAARRSNGIDDAHAGRSPRSSDREYLVGHGLGVRFPRGDAVRVGDASVIAPASTVAVPDGLARAMAVVMEPACGRAVEAREATMLQWRILKRTEEAAARLLPHLLAAGLDPSALAGALRKGLAGEAAA